MARKRYTWIYPGVESKLLALYVRELLRDGGAPESLGVGEPQRVGAGHMLIPHRECDTVARFSRYRIESTPAPDLRYSHAIISYTPLR